MAIKVYKRAVTVVSTTLADLGAGLETGDLRIEPNGSEYVLCKSAGSLVDGVGCIKDAATSSVITVIASAGVDQLILGVNNTGAVIATLTFCWLIKRGRGYGTPDAGGWNDGDMIATSATAATFDGFANAAATTTIHNILGIAISDDDQSVDANNLIQWQI